MLNKTQINTYDSYSHSRGTSRQQKVEGSALLYDGGAQRTFVTERLARELKLPVNETETHQFQSFGEKIQPNRIINSPDVTIRSLRKGEEDAIQMSML